MSVGQGGVVPIPYCIGFLSHVGGDHSRASVAMRAGVHKPPSWSSIDLQQRNRDTARVRSVPWSDHEELMASRP